MKLNLHIKLLLLLLCSCLLAQVQAQQTTTYQPTFEASNQPILGPNPDIDFSKKKIQDDPFGTFISLDQLGFQIKLGMEATPYFKFNELQGGNSDIVYPLQVEIQYPDDNTYGCNDWISINTSKSVRNNYSLNTTKPVMELEIGCDMKLGAYSGYDLSIGDINIGSDEFFDKPSGFKAADANNWQTLADDHLGPLWRINTNDGIEWPWSLYSEIPTPDDPSYYIPDAFPIDIPNWMTNNLAINGTLDSPFKGDQTDMLIDGKIVETATYDDFINLDFSPLQYQEFFTGIPLSYVDELAMPSGAASAINDALEDVANLVIGIFGGDPVSVNLAPTKVYDIDYTLFDLPINFAFDHSRTTSFNPGEVYIQFALGQSMEYRIIDPASGAAVESGTATNTIEMKAGYELQVKYPDGAPVTTQVVPTFISRDNEMSTKIDEKLTVSIGVVVLKGTVEVLDITVLNTPGLDQDFAALPPIDIPLFDDTFPVPDADFNTVTGNAFTLTPDMSAPVVNYLPGTGTQTLDDNGNLTLTSDDIISTVTDVDGGTEMVVSMPENYTCNNLGASVYSYTVKDDRCNEKTENFNFNLIDDKLPTAITKNITVSLDINGEVTILPEDVNNASTDNCGVTEYLLDVSTFNCNNIGPNTVTLTVKDGSNNQDMATATVTVVDDTPPTINSCSHSPIVFNGETTADAASFMVIDATDACGIASITHDPAQVTCDQAGTIVTITSTITDVNGLSSTCVTDVEISGLPCGWMDTGGIGCTGGSGYDGYTEEFTVTASGCEASHPYTADETGFIKHELCGDGSITALITGVAPGSGYAGNFGGVMIRETADPGSKLIAMGHNGNTFGQRRYRVLDNYPSFPQYFYNLDKFWVKIERTGYMFRGSVSADGVTWIPYLFQAVQMPDCILAGLYADGAAGSATFTNVSVEAANTPATLAADHHQGAAPSISQDDISAAPITESALNIFPNPTDGQVTATFSLEKEQEVTFDLYNQQGQLLGTLYQETLPNGHHLLPLQLSAKTNLGAGVYFLRMRSMDSTTTTRLILKP